MAIFTLFLLVVALFGLVLYMDRHTWKVSGSLEINGKTKAFKWGKLP